MTSRTIVWSTALAIVVATGLTLRVRGQAPDSGPWELATISDMRGGKENGETVFFARICYHVVDGCRWDAIKVKSKILNDTPFYEMPVGLAAASARLAAEGWEPVVPFPPTQIRGDMVMMKRKKGN